VSEIGDLALIEKAVTSRLAAITLPESRLYGNLLKTRAHLNSSMSAKACSLWSRSVGRRHRTEDGNSRQIGNT
jgi:hypothetical protein